jgi:hypothetical protein
LKKKNQSSSKILKYYKKSTRENKKQVTKNLYNRGEDETVRDQQFNIGVALACYVGVFTCLNDVEKFWLFFELWRQNLLF